MSLSDGRKAYRNFTWATDFEATTDADDCRVWGWGACNVDNFEDIEIGSDIASFIDWCQAFNSTCYFHNLRYDGSFILDYLLRHGFTHTAERNVGRGEFSTLISNMNQFYSIKVRWENGNLTEFRDSLKKLPMSVAHVAKSFKLDDTKGDIDYDKPRPVGYVMDDQERDYVIRDVRIMAKALAIQLNQGMTRLTVGSDALAEFKHVLTKKQFDRLFPVLPLSMDAEIRSAYRGGFTYADERTRGKIVGPGRTYDVNSLYPSVMYDRVLPYGEPRYVRGLPKVSENYPLFIVSVTFTAKLKPGHIPCIQVKNHSLFAESEYLSEISEPVTMSCTNIDLDLWAEHYDLDILSFNGGWSFRGVTGVFTRYIDKWMEIKNTHEGGLREIAKLHLNSLYGKFATNPNVSGKIPVLENNVVRLVNGPEEERNPVYTPMGVFITAYARDVTIRAAQRHYDSFLYADTDSLHLAVPADPATLDVDQHKLGAWKFEYAFDRALFARAKAYTTENPIDGKGNALGDLDDNGNRYVTHIAGLPREVAGSVRFEHYRTGHVFTGKLQQRRVPGGIVLTDVGFTLEAIS